MHAFFSRYSGGFYFLLFVACVIAGVFLFLEGGVPSRGTLSAYAIPLESITDVDLVLSEARHSKFVLLGESSHGTSEYYIARAEITKKLIEKHGTSFVVIEADWPTSYAVNRYVKGYESAYSDGEQALLSGARWPEWMWANEEFLEMVEWLREYNQARPEDAQVGLYGMDMQNLDGALLKAKRLLSDSKELSSEVVLRVEEIFKCFDSTEREISGYAEKYATLGFSCKEEVREAVQIFEQAIPMDERVRDRELFSLWNTLLSIEVAERYAREMVQGSSSWNTRARFMEKVVGGLAEHYGTESKGVVWAHNTHVGDARATDMASAGMVNIGQLLREKYGEHQVFILGFGTARGEVLAGREWGAPLEVMRIPAPRLGSAEQLLADISQEVFLLPFYASAPPRRLSETLLHRAKGVVYTPENEQFNYVQTIFSERYDAFIFIHTTSPLTPLSQKVQ